MERQLEQVQKQVQEYRKLMGKQGIDIDKKVSEWERKDRDEIKTLKFKSDQQASNLALKADEIKQLRAEV